MLKLLELLGAHHILYVSRLRVKPHKYKINEQKNYALFITPHIF